MSHADKVEFVADWQLPNVVPEYTEIWPRVRRRDDSEGPKAFILGPLVEDWPIEIHANRAEVGEALMQGVEKLRREWQAGAPAVGGSLAFHARAAQCLGYVPYLSCIIPAPCPATFNRLFEELNADTRYVRAMAGAAPGSVLLRFRDGHLLVPRSGVQRLATPVVPPKVFDEYDVVIVNPGPPPVRRQVLLALRKAANGNHRATPVAVAMRSDWTQEDLATLMDSPSSWAFANEFEVLDIAKTLSKNGRDVRSVEEAILQLKREVGSTRLLVTLGCRGGYLFNGKLVKFATRPVENGQAVGAGDTALVTTALSSAAGASDEVSTQRGINAGTRHVAGLPFVDRLEILD